MKKRSPSRQLPRATRALIKPDWLGRIARQVGEGVAVVDLKGGLVFANQAWARMHGRTINDLIGKNISIGHTRQQMKDDVVPFNKKVMKLGKWTGEVGHVKKNGAAFATEMTVTLLRDEHGRPAGLIGSARDISDRKRAEQAQQQLLRVMALVSQCNQAIARARDEKQLLKGICDIIVSTGGYRMSWVGSIDPRDQRTVVPTAVCGAERGYLKVVRIESNGALGQGPTGRALRRRRPVVCRDIHTDRRYRPWRREALKRGYSSSAAFPLIARKRLVGALNIYADRRDAFDRQEVSLLNELADDLAHGIIALRDRQALATAGRTMRHQLRQLSQRQADLAESDHRYRELSDTLPQTVFEMDARGRLLYANRTAFQQFGYRNEDVAKGVNVLDLLLPQDRERARANIERRLAGQLSEHQEYTAIRRDGTTFPINIYARTIMRDGRVAGLRGVIVDITARKQIEGSLLESEAKFRALAETSPSGIFVYREKFLYVNPACEELTGYSRGELLDLKFWDFVHPDFRELIRQRGLARQRGELIPSHYEFKIIRKDGEERWVDFAATAVTYEGAPAGMGTVTDVTEKKLAEQRLRQSEEFNRSIIDHSPIGIAIRDNKGRLLGYNDAWVRIWAMSDQDIERHSREITDRTFEQIYDHLGEHLEAVRTVFKTGGSLFLPELRIPAPRPGGARWVRQYFYTINDPHGAIDRIVVLTDDITGQKEAEAQLQKSRMQYQTLSLMSPVGIFQTDAEGSTIYVNPRWCEIAGVPLSAAMADDWLDVVHPDDRERVVKGWQQAVRDRLPSASEYRFRRPDGSVRWVMGQAVPELNSDGAVLGYVGTITDITERKVIEQALSDSELKYRQIFDGIVEGIFQSSVSGELLTANPALIKMLGYDSLQELQGLNIERDGYVDADNRKRFLQMLNQHGEVWGFQSRWRRKDGTIIIISENARLVRDERGRPRYYEGTVEDITEHVNADMALLDEKEKLSQLFEVSLSVARAGTIQRQLDLTIKGLAELKLFRRMVIIVKDNEGRNAHLAQFGLQPQEVELIRQAPPASAQARALIFDPRHRISNSYFIPHDADEAIRQATAVLDSSDTAGGEWHPRDNLTVPLVVKGKFIGYISADEPVDGMIPSMETVRLLELYANQAAIAVENLHLYNDLERSYYDTLKAFVAAMEAKDPYTKGHSENVRLHALKLAQFMGLPPDRIRLIDYSSLLHDIGKLGVKEQILSKPSLLSALEYEEVKQHPVIGSQMVSAIENLSSTAPIIHSHHEFYDGSGYPGGIKGEQIPLESRIISVADAFEAMTSDRPYRKAFGFREALQRLEQAAGTQFDREIVSAFIAMAAQEETDAARE